MRKTIIAIAVCLALSTPASAVSEEKNFWHGWTGNVNLLLGAKFLEKDNWEPVDTQIQGGFLLDFRRSSWWISIAVDLLYAGAGETVELQDLGIGTYSAEVESRTMEINLGLRKVWETPYYVRPFIGGGFAIINGRIESEALGSSVTEENTGYGVWLNAGLYATFYRHFNIGIDGRWSKAEADLFDREARLGGWHVGVLAGFHW